MFRRTTLAIFALGMLAGWALRMESRPLAAQDKPTREYLPMFWGLIGLSEEQKETVYTIKRKYGADETKLEAEVDAARKVWQEKRAALATLQSNEKKELLAVLTAAQRDRLGQVVKEMAEGKSRADLLKEAKAAGTTIVDPNEPAPATPPEPASDNN